MASYLSFVDCSWLMSRSLSSSSAALVPLLTSPPFICSMEPYNSLLSSLRNTPLQSEKCTNIESARVGGWGKRDYAYVMTKGKFSTVVASCVRKEKRNEKKLCIAQYTHMCCEMWINCNCTCSSARKLKDYLMIRDVQTSVPRFKFEIRLIQNLKSVIYKINSRTTKLKKFTYTKSDANHFTAKSKINTNYCLLATKKTTHAKSVLTEWDGHDQTWLKLFCANTELNQWNRRN